MHVQVLRSERENAYGFIVAGVSCDQLRWILRQNANVTYISKRRFFFWSDSVKVEFVFVGIRFEICPDDWDSSLWITTEENTKHGDRVIDLSNYIDDSLKALDRIPFQKINFGKPAFLGLLLSFPLLMSNSVANSLKVAALGIWCLTCLLWSVQLLLYFFFRGKALSNEN